MNRTSQNLTSYILGSIVVHMLFLFATAMQTVEVIDIQGSIDLPEVIAITLKTETLMAKPKTVKKITQTVKSKQSAISNPAEKSQPLKPVKSQTAQIKGRKSREIINKYTQELKAFLDKKKVYPRMAARMKQSGVVKIKLAIGARGKFKNVEILTPAPFDSLNKSTLSFLAKLGRFKPLPEEFYPEEEFIIPVVYRLTSRFR